MAAEVGAIIGGRYVVERELGAGGMGVVVLARDPRLKRSVAVKLLAPSALGNSSLRDRLLREATAAAGLAHPGIIHVYDVGETDDGGAFLVMEVISGRSLGEVLRAGGLTRAELLRIIREVAVALEYAHKLGFVHRDVKPDNIMVRDDGRAVLLDFGLAKPIDAEVSMALTATGVIVGTPAYMAPEQNVDEVVDARADQYALAIVAFEAFTGQLPWSATSILALVVAKAAGHHLVASALAPDLPPKVDEVFARALARDPAGRFATIVDFADALAAVPGLASADQFAKSIELGVASTIASGSRVVDVSTENPSAAPGPSGVARRAATRLSARPPGPPPSRRWLVGALVGVVGLAAAGVAVVSSRTRGAAPTGAGWPSPLLVAGSVLACPQLAATGVEAPSGWLGAAAAGVACERARVLFAGGRTERTLAPAELLDLPRSPSDRFPADPYGADGARDRAISAARSRAGAYLDGRVEARPKGFVVELVLRANDDHELARGRGEAPSVFGAVRQAMTPLVSDAALPLARGIEPELAPWEGPTVDAALAAADLALVVPSTPDLPAECEAIKARLVLPERVALATFICAYVRGLDAPPLTSPVLDDSSPARLEQTTRIAWVLDPKLDTRAAAARIEAALQTESSAAGRARLAATASCLRQAAGDPGRALELAMQGVQVAPRPTFGGECTLFSQVATLSADSASAVGAARAQAAWEPFSPIAPRMLAPVGSPDWLVAARRGHTLAPLHVTIAVDLAIELLRDNQRQEARAIAAALTDGVLQHAAATLVLARIDASEAQFGAALTRLRRTLPDLDATGFVNNESFELWRFARDIALLLGRERELADEFATSFLTRGRPSIPSYDEMAVASAASVCLYASRPSATACFDKLRAVTLTATEAQAGSLGLLEGARAFARHDLSAAAAAWRPLTRGLAIQVGLVGDALPVALAAAGDVELAARIDAQSLDGHGPFNGVSSAHVRAALAADAHGDKARAKELASQVISAWATADVPPPSLTAMRRLLPR